MDGASGNDSLGEKDTDDGDSGSGSEGATPAHSFTFDEARVPFTAGGTYTRAVVEINKPAGDARAITSSATAIAATT